MRRADSLATFVSRLSTYSGNLNLLKASGPVHASIRIALFLPLIYRFVDASTDGICLWRKRKVP